MDTKGSHWEIDAIAATRDSNADLNLFYIWKFVTSPTGKVEDLKGLTWLKDIFISDLPFVSEDIDLNVMAHEIGHGLGISGDKHFYNPKNRGKYVMFFSAKASGKIIPKIHVNIVNL